MCNIYTLLHYTRNIFIKKKKTKNTFNKTKLLQIMSALKPDTATSKPVKEEDNTSAPAKKKEKKERKDTWN